MSLSHLSRQSGFCLRLRLTPSLQRALATSSATSETSNEEPHTHFRITQRRSAISLQEHVKGTLLALGLHRRHQTVYKRHTPEAAGMILAVKELVEVENVPASAVRTQHEQTMERKAPRGFVVTGSKVGNPF